MLSSILSFGLKTVGFFTIKVRFWDLIVYLLLRRILSSHTEIFSIIYISIIPIVDLPTAYNFTAWFISALACAFIAVSRVDIPWKWAFAICPLLMPHGGEVFINFTDIQWIVSPILIIFCIEPPARDKKTIAVEVFLTIIIGLTGPFSLMIFPLFCIKLAAKKFAKAEIPLFAAITFAASLQAYALLRDAGVSSEAITTWTRSSSLVRAEWLRPAVRFRVVPSSDDARGSGWMRCRFRRVRGMFDRAFPVVAH